MSPKKNQPKKVPCPDCGGSGQLPWAESMLKCDACNGTGKVKG